MSRNFLQTTGRVVVFSTLAAAFVLLAARFASAADFPLLAASGDTNQVLEYSSSGAYESVFAAVANTPKAIVIGPNGNVFVSTFGSGGFNNGTNGTIQEFTTAGAPVGAGPFVQAGNTVVAEAFAPDGSLYFTTPNGLFRANGTTGAIDNSFSFTGSQPGSVRGLAVIPTGGGNYDLAVGNGAGNATVTFLNSSGTVLSSSNVGTVLQGLALSPSGTLVDSDGVSGIYQLLNAGSANLSSSPSFTQLDSAAAAHTNVPVGIAFDSAGNMYFSNNGGVNGNPFNNVVELTSGGTYVQDFVASGAGGLSGVQGIAFLPVPEPSSLVLLGCACAAVLVRGRKRLVAFAAARLGG